MDQAATLDQFYDTAVRNRLWSSTGSMRRYFEWFARGVEFRGRRMLDVGGGTGLMSCYAAARGAREVVCLEPEAAGGAAGMNAEFARVAGLFGVSNTRLLPTTFQQFDGEPSGYDILCLHNSINHLNEEACIKLAQGGAYADAYRALFRKLAALAAPGADLLLADCTPRNLFPMLGLKHPIVPYMEWHKHQPPEMWVNLLREVGFECPSISWSSYNRLGRLGWLLFANRPGASVLTGHFRIHMTKKP